MIGGLKRSLEWFGLVAILFFLATVIPAVRGAGDPQSTNIRTYTYFYSNNPTTQTITITEAKTLYWDLDYSMALTQKLPISTTFTPAGFTVKGGSINQKFLQPQGQIDLPAGTYTLTLFGGTETHPQQASGDPGYSNGVAWGEAWYMQNTDGTVYTVECNENYYYVQTTVVLPQKKIPSDTNVISPTDNNQTIMIPSSGLPEPMDYDLRVWYDYGFSQFYYDSDDYKTPQLTVTIYNQNGTVIKTETAPTKSGYYSIPANGWANFTLSNGQRYSTAVGNHHHIHGGLPSWLRLKYKYDNVRPETPQPVKVNLTKYNNIYYTTTPNVDVGFTTVDDRGITYNGFEEKSGIKDYHIQVCDQQSTGDYEETMVGGLVHKEFDVEIKDNPSYATPATDAYTTIQIPSGDKPYFVKIIAIDHATMHSLPSDEIQIRYLSGRPETPGMPTVDGLENLAHTKQSSLTWSWNPVNDPCGLGIKEYRVHIEKNGVAVGNDWASVASATRYTYLIPDGQEGIYTCRVKALNFADVEGMPSQPGTIVVDRSVPLATLPAYPVRVNGNKATFTWNTISDTSNIDRYEVALTQTTDLPVQGIQNNGTNLSCEFSGIDWNNQYYAWVRGVDILGNIGPWTRIGPFPDVMYSPKNDISFNNQASQTFTITSLTGKTLKAQVLSVGVANAPNNQSPLSPSPISVAFNEGVWAWSLDIYEVDKDGNKIADSKQTTPSYQIKTDRTAPTGKLTVKSSDGGRTLDTTDNPSNSLQIRLIGSALSDRSDNGSGIAGAYFWNGNSSTRPIDPSSYTYKSLADLASPDGFLWRLDNGTDGDRTITMQILDNAGNTDIVTYTVKLDRSAPGVPGNFGHSFSQAGDSIQFTWTINDAQDLTKFAGFYTLPDGTQVPFDNITPTQQGEGVYQGTLSVPIGSLGPNLPVSITVHAVDKAGNGSADSTPYYAFTKAVLGSLEDLPGGYDPATHQHYLKWRLNATHGQAAGYILEYGVRTDQGFSAQGKVDPDASGIFTVTGISAHSTCDYRLVALNGSTPADRTEGVIFNRQAADEPPSPPTLNAPQEFAGTGFAFSYNESLDADGDALTYQVYVKNQDDSQYAPYTSGYQFVHGHTYYWYVVANDGHGELTPSDTVVRFTADFNPPTLNIQNLVGEYINLTQLPVAASDDLSGIVKVTFQKVPGDQTATELTLVSENGQSVGEIPLAEGAYSLVVTAVDKAGNYKTVNMNNLQIDRTIPILSEIQLDLSQANGRYLLAEDQATVHWTATDDASSVQSLCYQLVTKSGDPMTSPHTINLSKNLNHYQYSLKLSGQDGQEFYLAMAVMDRAGNMSSIQYVGPILIDKTPPQLKFGLTGFHVCGSAYYVANLNELSSQVTCNDEETGVTTPEFAVQNDKNVLVVNWTTWDNLQKATLQPGRYRVICRAFNGVQLEADAQSAWFIDDNTPPQGLSLSVPSHALIAGEQAVFSSSAVENDSTIVRYSLSIGSTPGGTELTALIPGNQDGWIAVDSNQTTQSFRIIIPAVGNGAYYATLKVENAAGLTVTMNGGVFTIDNTQERVVVTDQGPFTMVADQLSAAWSYHGTRTVKEYQYQIVSGDNQVVSDWTTTSEPSVRRTGLLLEQSKTYHFKVKVVLADGGEVTGESTGVIIDATPPEITNLITPVYSTSSNLSFAWSGQDDISGIRRVQVALGSDYGQTDVTGGWLDVTGFGMGLSCKADGTNLNLQTGSRYYLMLRLTNGAGLTIERITPAITVDDQAPPIPVVVDQGSYINMVQDLKANWIWSPTDTVSGTTFQWALLDNARTVTSATVWHTGDISMKIALSDADYPRTNGHTYYFAVKAINGAGLASIGYSDGIMVDATAPYIPDVTLKQAVNFGQDKKEVTYITSLDNLELWIDSLDPESDIDRYEYAYGPKTFVDTAPENSTPNAVNPLGNPLIEEGDLTIFKGECYNGADLKSQPGYSVGVVLDSGAPRIVNVHGGVSSNMLLFDWSADLGPNDGTIHSPVAWYEVALVPEDKVNDDPSSWTNVGLKPFYAFDGKNLSDGYYRLLIRACNQAGTISRRQGSINEWGISPRITVDRQSPTLLATGFRYPRYAGAQMTVDMAATDDLSGIGGYQYALGDVTDPFKYTRGWVDLESRDGSIEFNIVTSDIPHGTRVYLMVRAKDGVGLWSDALISQSILIDHSPPTTPVITCGTYTRFANLITGIGYSAHDPESGLTHYRLGIVQDGSEDLLATQTGAIEDFNGTFSGLNLEEGNVYRLLLQVQNGAGNWSEVGISDPIILDFTSPVLTFTQGNTTVVLNRPPVDISFTLSEPATVDFVLIAEKDGSTKTFHQTFQEGANTFVFQEADQGTYRLKATSTDAAGNIGTTDQPQMIRVNTPPIVSLSPMANTSDGGVATTPGAPVSFAASVSDPDGDPQETLTYQWETGVSGETVLTGSSPTYHYQALGTYTLKLTVADQDGGVSTTTITVTVGNTTRGTLYQDEVWSGVHHVIGDVTVPVGVKLTILPGTTVLVDEGFGITINGMLVTSKGSPIKFKSIDGGKWQGIEVEGRATMDGVLIKNAYQGLTVAGLADVTIRNCIFQSNEVGLHVLDVKPSVDQCSFLDNTLYGVKEDEGGRPIVTHCRFAGNGNDYYQEDETVITIDELNGIDGNGDNYE